jgi:hypothetical protein
MKCSDWIISFIAKQGVDTVFMLPGGGAMFLVDSLGKSKEVKYVPMLHEQAAGFAAMDIASLEAWEFVWSPPAPVRQMLLRLVHQRGLTDHRSSLSAVKSQNKTSKAKNNDSMASRK